MLKIETLDDGMETKTLLLSGSISGVWVSELRRCCETLLREGSRVNLDLGDVQYADRAGLELLSQLIATRVPVVRWTPLLAQLLTALQAEQTAGFSQAEEQQ